MPARELAKGMSVVLTHRVSAGVSSPYGLVALGRYSYADWTGRYRDHKTVEIALQVVGSEDVASRHVIEPSDGERQRIMVAHALAQETPLRGECDYETLGAAIRSIRNETQN
jgi:iron complex transport system ATP-binding protein